MQFQFDKVTFASVNATLCGGRDVRGKSWVDGAEDVVGTVEWAPMDDDTDLDHPLMIVMLVFLVICFGAVVYLMRMQSKKYGLEGDVYLGKRFLLMRLPLQLLDWNRLKILRVF